MFICSLPAELLFNDKPLAMKLDGKWFFPVFNSYAYEDLGGDTNLPVISYRSPTFRDFLDGTTKKYPSELLFGDEDESVNCSKQKISDVSSKYKSNIKKGEKRNVWFLWAPVQHSYKSITYNPKCGRTNLASPRKEHLKYENKNYPSSWVDGHYLGTDTQGRDVLARIVYGFRISLLFGFGIAFCGTLIGSFLGALQGFFGGWVDLLGQRAIEVWSSMPRLFLLIILSSFLSRRAGLTTIQHFLLLFFILNLTSWMGMASHMRAQFLRARNLEYVKAARALGLSDLSIMFKHILPNSLIPIITFFPFSIRAGILALTSLDFLDLGVQYPAPSLGELLSQGQQHLHAYWILLPTFAILSFMLMLLTFIGDGVRDAFDPRTK